MSENILINVKNFNCFKGINFMDNNDILHDYVTFFAEIYLCGLNIPLTFHYMIFKSEQELNIKLTQL